MILEVLLLVFGLFAFGADNHPVCEELLFRYETHPNAEVRLAACNRLARSAEARGLDVALTIELAWSESRFVPTAVNSTSGCSGILQAAPQFWCPGRTREGCDLQEAGLRALEHYLGRHKDETKALCHFKSGNVCNPAGLNGAKTVMRKVRWLRERMQRRIEGNV